MNQRNIKAAFRPGSHPFKGYGFSPYEGQSLRFQESAHATKSRSNPRSFALPSTQSRAPAVHYSLVALDPPSGKARRLSRPLYAGKELSV
jgi:hypothetical protein